MKNFFGIPMSGLSVALLIVFGVSLLGLAFSVLRNWVMFRMAARNLPRRRLNTVLTVLGLMLAAMIFSASFSTGDTLSYSIRRMAVTDLGQVDIMVMREGVEFSTLQSRPTGYSLALSYFDSEYFQQVRESLDGEPAVEGVAPAIIERVPVVARGSRLNEPSVGLLGLDPQYMESFDPLINSQGDIISIQDLGVGEVYISQTLAKRLEGGIGSGIDVYLNEVPRSFTIRGIYEQGGSPSGNLSIVMPLSQMQAIRASEDINFIIITNRGDVINGAKHTDDILGALDSEEAGLEDIGLKAEPVKQDALEAADEAGSEFSRIFLVFGSFSIIAGVLLIFLIFVMLAAERKRELGIARAIGTQRGHIIRMFTYEGVLYALIASAIGSFLGILFGMGMIKIMAIAFEEIGEDDGFQMVYNFTGNSLIISYTLGVVLTLVVVVFSAWRVGRLNIVRAIRDIPDPQVAGKPGIKGLIISIILPLLGIMLFVLGVMAKQLAPYMLGGSLAIIGLCLLGRRFRLSDRTAYSLLGIGLLIFWLMPFEYHPFTSEMTSGIEMFTLSGIFLVAGAVCLVIYNSDLLLAAITSLFGRIKTLVPVLKTAVSYPMASRFRTGMALALFSLIIFTLTVISVINASFGGLLNDTDRFSGGFQIRSQVSYNNPIPDINAAIGEPEGVGLDNFQTIAGINRFGARMRQADKGQEWEEDLYLTGADPAYTGSFPYSFAMMTGDYTSGDQVWTALSADPSLVVVSAIMVPTRNGHMMGETSDLQIGEGEFFIEDKVLPDSVYLEVQNPFTGEIRKLQVIGVLEIMAGYAAPVTTSQATINELAGYPVPQTTYMFKVEQERLEDVPQLAMALEKQFLENGMDATVISEEIKDFNKLNSMFFNLITVFMGLGLIVGIAALGVIAARSVVERRQQIGVLRAIGFQRRMVQFSFMMESSFIALLGIFIGVALGLALSVQLIPDMEVEGITTVIPWVRLTTIIGVAYLASLATTFMPAYQASRVYPAEALRYE